MVSQESDRSWICQLWVSILSLISMLFCNCPEGVLVCLFFFFFFYPIFNDISEIVISSMTNKKKQKRQCPNSSKIQLKNHTTNANIHNCSLSWLGIDTSMKGGGSKLALLAKWILIDLHVVAYFTNLQIIDCKILKLLVQLFWIVFSKGLGVQFVFNTICIVRVNASVVCLDWRILLSNTISNTNDVRTV